MLNRRGFLGATGAIATLRFIPNVATRVPSKRIVTLVYDKAIGAMRLVDKVIR